MRAWEASALVAALSAAGCFAEGLEPDPMDLDAGPADGGAADAGARCREFDRDVQGLFDRTCVFSGCHAAPNPSAGLDLSPGRARDHLVGVTSTQTGGLLVDPGAPPSSYLITKLANDRPPVGARMPLGRRALPTDAVDLVRDWIAAGAPAGPYPPCGPAASAPTVQTVEVTGDGEVGLGGVAEVRAIPRDSNQQPIDGATALWRSADETQLYVDADGRMVGLSVGISGAIAQVGGVDSAPWPVSILGGAPSTTPSFADDVVPILRARCGLSACHVEGVDAGELWFDRSPALIYGQLIGVEAGQFPMLQITGGVPAQSFLFRKLTDTDPPAGRQMPLGQARLGAPELATIYTWIVSGAPQN